MDNIMGRVETIKREWDSPRHREREKASENFVLWKFFLKLSGRVTVDDEQGLATLVHVGQWYTQPVKTRKSCWKKTDPKGKKRDGKLSIKLVLTWDPTASVITVRYTTANDYVSNPISASKALSISTTSAISTASLEGYEGKGPNIRQTTQHKNTPSETTPPPFFSLIVSSL